MEEILKCAKEIFVDTRSIVFLITLCFILLDVVTGYLQAIANNNVRSEKMRQGFWHKLGIIFVLILAGLIDVIVAIGMGEALGFTAPIFIASCGYIVLMELTSILENIVKMNPELANNKIMGLFYNEAKLPVESGIIELDGAAPEVSKHS